jgi:Zn-dependent peptidase ImmA (M78 family)/transcriptional regulator with XRE-family HTH domain
MKVDSRIRPKLLGLRLKNARLLIGLTQEAAARPLAMARTTLAAIEAGKRAISAAELRSFSELYGVGEGELLADGRSALELEVKIRGSAGEQQATQLEAAALLHRLAAASVELEDMLECPYARQDMPSIVLGRDQPLDQQAEDAALAMRQRIGGGLGPIANIVSLLEADFGIRVFERPLPSTVSGAVAFNGECGGFILLNSNHARQRRRQTAVHELCHVLLRKAGVSVLLSEGEFDEREERFCDAFGFAMLMPASAVRKKTAELKALSNEFSVRHLLMMAIYFDVSIEAMARRLEALGMAPKGLFSSLKDRGLGLPHLEQVRSELGSAPAAQFTPRLFLLAGAAFDRELLSEQQIARMLELDLVTVRKMLESVAKPEGLPVEYAG